MFTLTVPHPNVMGINVRVDTREIEEIIGVELWHIWLYLFEELNAIQPYPGGLDRFITSIEVDMQIATTYSSDRDYRRYINNYEVIIECLNHLYAHMKQTLINIMMQRPVIRTYNPACIHIAAICNDSLILHLFNNEVERDDWCSRKASEAKIVMGNNRLGISGPGGVI